jgi:hypothetical protein
MQLKRDEFYHDYQKYDIVTTEIYFSCRGLEYDIIIPDDIQPLMIIDLHQVYPEVIPIMFIHYNFENAGHVLNDCFMCIGQILDFRSKFPEKDILLLLNYHYIHCRYEGLKYSLEIFLRILEKNSIKYVYIGENSSTIYKLSHWVKCYGITFLVSNIVPPKANLLGSSHDESYQIEILNQSKKFNVHLLGKILYFFTNFFFKNINLLKDKS